MAQRIDISPSSLCRFAVYGVHSAEVEIPIDPHEQRMQDPLIRLGAATRSVIAENRNKCAYFEHPMIRAKVEVSFLIHSPVFYSKTIDRYFG